MQHKRPLCPHYTRAPPGYARAPEQCLRMYPVYQPQGLLATAGAKVRHKGAFRRQIYRAQHTERPAGSGGPQENGAGAQAAPRRRSIRGFL
ncbi:MAG: hypothetical protein DBY17_09745 [Oscillospiraceae bacterium]|nr:MAG: hypothetical protein DBY17_09745 [Oscillospiraceae bacterium]